MLPVLIYAIGNNQGYRRPLTKRISKNTCVQVSIKENWQLKMQELEKNSEGNQTF